MSKAIRKPRPSPPKWYWWDSDNCWFCNNKRNCSNCKILKEYNQEQKEKRLRQDKGKLKKREYEDF